MMGEFAPKLVELTDHVPFGDIWERPELSKMSAILMAKELFSKNGASV
jgi:4-carboxymuconolactone decarboxylase